MKKMIYMISLLFLLGCTGSNIKYNDTEIKNGLIYNKNNSKPYTGKVTFYYLESESILGTGNFLNGKAEGVFIGYYESGKIKSESTIVNDKLEISRTYYENGQLKEEYNKNKFEKYNEQGERIIW